MCAPHAACQSNHLSCLLSLITLRGRRGEGPSVPRRCGPFSLFTVSSTWKWQQGQPYLTRSVSVEQVTPGMVSVTPACITYQPLCSQLYLIEPLSVKIIQVKYHNPEKHYKKREVLDSKEIELSWKSTHKHQVQTDLTGNLY